MIPDMRLRIVLQSANRWVLAVEHPAGHVVLLPLAYRTYDAAREAIVQWEIARSMDEWPI